MAYTAELIAVGTELLLGNIANTDAQDVSRALSEIGINVYYHTVVGDNPERLKKAVAIAKDRADIIITTGGLGPTFDDLTKQTLAEAFGKKLVFNEEEAQRIRAFFETRLRNVEMTENNFQQAMLPEDCTIFRNGCGTAPGCAIEAGGKHVLMLPGPPRECRAMLKACAIPYLKKLSDSEIHSHNIHIFGMGESSVEARLREMMEEMENPTLAPYAKESEVLLRLTAKAVSKEEAERMMAPVLEQVRSVLGDIIYGIDTDTLENTAAGLLSAKNMTLSAAESCTGGMMAQRITDIPGASRFFFGGVTTYSNKAKADILGIDGKLIEEKGAVSREVAEQMAQKVRALFYSDLGIGITGIAGPDSDETGTEPGTVFVALSAADGLYCRSLNLYPDRTRVRIAAASHALDMIRRYLTGITVV
jgi:nicotinamide-nucleotide amidase